MAVSLVKHWYVTGPDGQGNVSFSENPADALLFVDATEATAFSAGTNLAGAVPMTLTDEDLAATEALRALVTGL